MKSVLPLCCAGLTILMSCSGHEYLATWELNSFKDDVRLLTLSGATYVVKVDTVDADRIYCTGTKTDKAGTDPYTGWVKVDSITHIIASDNMGLFGIVLTGTYIGYIAVDAISSVGSPGVSAREYVPSSRPGEGSCPLVFSRTGGTYVLEGEAFGTALGRGLETETGTVLTALEGASSPEWSIVNARPETHFVDRVTLTAVAHEPSQQVILGPDQRAWVVGLSNAPSSAEDEWGRDARAMLSGAGDEQWASAGPHDGDEDALTDEVIVQWDDVTDGGLVGLSVRARNTQLAGHALQYLYELLGDETLDFIAASDSDPGMISLLSDWLDRASMTVDMETESGWRQVGVVQPEAIEVDFTRLVPIAIPPGHGSTLRLRFRTIADGWTIDAVGLHQQIGAPDWEREVQCVCEKNDHRAGVSDRIANADGSYEVLLPGDTLSFCLSSLETLSPEERTFIVRARGYLHEWPRMTASLMTVSDHPAGAGPRLRALMVLLRNPDVLLPAVYETWWNGRDQMLNAKLRNANQERN